MVNTIENIILEAETRCTSISVANTILDMEDPKP